MNIMDFAANFTAIDFETASHQPDSACQLGAVVVRDGQVVDQFMWMIRPEPLYFSQGNIRIHGITPAQVREESNFGDIWSEISSKIGNDCLVAHNASFDIKVLLACLRTHQKSIPEFHFTCTRAIARRTWPHHRRYGLKPLSNWLGIRFQHHDALEDSIACAKILLAAGIDREATSLDHLEKILKLNRGKAGAWGYRGATGKSKRQTSGANPKAPPPGSASGLPFLFPNQLASSGKHDPNVAESEPEIDMQRILVRGEFVRPLSGKRIVFSGKLRWMSPSDAETLTARLGGTWQETVDQQTDYLVMGSIKRSSATNDGPDNAHLAQSFSEAGHTVKVVDEREFLKLVMSYD
jgi:DNA polymerase-3 subunit epsilon